MTTNGNGNGNGKRALPQVGADPVADLPAIEGFRRREGLRSSATGCASRSAGIRLEGGEPPLDVYDTSGSAGHRTRTSDCPAAQAGDPMPGSPPSRRQPQPVALTRPRRGDAGDAVRGDPRARRAGVRARRDRARPGHPAGQRSPPESEPMMHRPQLPGEDQRQHRNSA